MKRNFSTPSFSKKTIESQVTQFSRTAKEALTEPQWLFCKFTFTNYTCSTGSGLLVAFVWSAQAPQSPLSWLLQISLLTLLAANLFPNAVKYPTPSTSKPPALLSLHLTQKLLTVPFCLSMPCPLSQHVHRTVTLLTFPFLPFLSQVNVPSQLILYIYIHTCIPLPVIHIIYNTSYKCFQVCHLSFDFVYNFLFACLLCF